MSDIQIFDFQENAVRVVIQDGEPRWVASDVAKVLGYRDAANMTRMLDEDEKATHNVRTSQVSAEFRRMTVITEAGLYACILKSRVPAAREFKRWVIHEILPAIRKHGGYLTPAAAKEALTDPDFIIRLATQLKEERARTAELEGPAKAWSTFQDEDGDYSVSDAAKVLCRDPAIEIGRQRLFDFMAEQKWIFRVTGRRAHWAAYQDKGIKTGRLVQKLSGSFFNERTGVWEQGTPTIRITTKGLYDLHQLLGGTTQSPLHIA